LASYRTFWLAHPLGRCTRVASPSTQTASPTSAISPSQRRRVVQAADEDPVGLAEAELAKRAEQQVQAVADLGLEDADRPAGASVRQSVQQHGGDGVQADLQRQWWGAALVGWAWWEQGGQAGGQPGQYVCGQRRAGAV
jgi:hypothetical protein